MYVYYKIFDIPLIYLLLVTVPFLNIYLAYIIGIAVAQAFGKSKAFGLLCMLFLIIILPYLAFSKAEYVTQIKGIKKSVEPKEEPKTENTYTNPPPQSAPVQLKEEAKKVKSLITIEKSNHVHMTEAEVKFFLTQIKDESIKNEVYKNILLKCEHYLLFRRIRC